MVIRKQIFIFTFLNVNYLNSIGNFDILLVSNIIYFDFLICKCQKESIFTNPVTIKNMTFLLQLKWKLKSQVFLFLTINFHIQIMSYDSNWISIRNKSYTLRTLKQYQIWIFDILKLYHSLIIDIKDVDYIVQAIVHVSHL